MVRTWIRIKQLDPDPYQSEKHDSDLYKSEKQETDPYPYQKGLDRQHWPKYRRTRKEPAEKGRTFLSEEGPGMGEELTW
jgi:hypothetical protein